MVSWRIHVTKITGWFALTKGKAVILGVMPVKDGGKAVEGEGDDGALGGQGVG